MFGTILLGRPLGIKLYIHWTFWLLLIWVLLPALSRGGPAAATNLAAMLFALFACVVLHEYGHAMCARYYGIGTHDITVLPIGGLARLERLPEKPFQECMIALAGPAVNVVIALLLLLILVGMGSVAAIGSQRWFSGGYDVSTVISELFWVNCVLVGFNLLPAFPMDGGRVLRSLLAMRMPQLKATIMAVSLGRWMALIFAILAPIYSWSLLLIAGFIYVAGTMELWQVRLRSIAMESAERGGFSYTFGGNWNGQTFQGSSEDILIDPTPSRAQEKIIDAEYRVLDSPPPNRGQDST